MNYGHEQAIIEWAHRYNGYERIARSPEQLSLVLRPLEDAWERDGAVPDWAGVDLLRAWAFLIAREHRFGGYGSIFREYPVLPAVLDAIRNNGAATSADLPPVPEEDTAD